MWQAVRLSAAMPTTLAVRPAVWSPTSRYRSFVTNSPLLLHCCRGYRGRPDRLSPPVPLVPRPLLVCPLAMSFFMRLPRSALDCYFAPLLPFPCALAVRRLPAYDDPAERVTAFRHQLGDRLVVLLSSLPTPLREPTTLTTLPFIVWAVHDALTGGGFAVSSIVRPANDDRSVATQWVTPATLWGEAYGAARGDLGHPYDVLAVQALARAAGLGPVRARVRRDDSSLYREYTLVE